MAIDYGTKRTGIAVSDPGRIIATALDTIPTGKIIDFLKQYLVREKVDLFVVGYPRKMNNTPSEMAIPIEKFTQKLKETFPKIPVHWMDERFTSKIAKESMLLDGSKKSERRRKELVDMRSAVLILQSYMEMNKS
jgi:putative Holliday junction resolvase